MKIAIMSLVLALLATACSRKTETAQSTQTNTAPSKIVWSASMDTAKPHFEFTSSDLAAPAEIGTNGIGSGRYTVVIHIALSAEKTAELAQFTQEHLHQQAQLLFNSKVIADSYILDSISDGHIDLSFQSNRQAQAAENLLNGK